MGYRAETLHWADYLVFSAMLACSIGIGVFYACTGSKQRTQDEYLLGGRKMGTLPVAVSIAVSFLSAITMLGVGAEMHQQGVQWWISSFGYCIAAILAALIFVPLLYPLKLTSSYEYLERRYHSKAVRLTGDFLIITSQIIYMSLVIYAPSSAMATVTGFPVWASILCIGVAATFYTTLGGLKAVIWTDVLQAVIMTAGVLAIIIAGSVEVGGVAKVWEIATEGNRTTFFSFDPDPRTRHTSYYLIFGSAVSWLTTYGVKQSSVQRYCSVSTLCKAKTVVYLNALIITFFMTITCFSGIVVYAYYASIQCDPLRRGIIRNPNQLVPTFVMEVIGYPGIPGLLMAAIFSGALSSMSSTVNSLAAVVWEDLLKVTLGKFSELKRTAVLKILAFLFGVLGTGLAFAAGEMEVHVLQAAVLFDGATAGPLLGIFLMGALFPQANWIGAVIGPLCGLGVTLWISLGALSKRYGVPMLPSDISNCTAGPANYTYRPPTTMDELHGIDQIYTISYTLYSTIGVITTLLIGMVISCATGCSRGKEVYSRYMICDKLSCLTPKGIIKEEKDSKYDTNPETQKTTL